MKKNSFLENCIFLHIKKKIFGDVKNSETSLGLLIECKWSLKKKKSLKYMVEKQTTPGLSSILTNSVLLQTHLGTN